MPGAVEAGQVASDLQPGFRGDVFGVGADECAQVVQDAGVEVVVEHLEGVLIAVPGGRQRPGEVWAVGRMIGLVLGAAVVLQGVDGVGRLGRDVDVVGSVLFVDRHGGNALLRGGGGGSGAEPVVGTVEGSPCREQVRLTAYGGGRSCPSVVAGAGPSTLVGQMAALAWRRVRSWLPIGRGGSGVFVPLVVPRSVVAAVLRGRALTFVSLLMGT